MDRDADRLMVAYLYLEFAAMFVDESYFASEAPLCCMDADGRNHARLAADDVRRNFRTITLDLQRLRMRVALLVVDAHIPAAEVVEGQSGAVEPLAESVARPADERTALAVLLRARALTQNVEVGGNRPVGAYWAAEQCSFHGSMVSRRSACVDKSPLHSQPLGQCDIRPLPPCLDAQVPRKLTSLYLEFCLPVRKRWLIVRSLLLPPILEPTIIL